MRKLILFLFLAAFYKPVGAQTDPCAGLVTPRLLVGATGRIMVDDGIGLVLRDAPSTTSQVIVTLREGAIFTALELPTCADGLVWLRVRLADGREGYLAEGGADRYYVEPYEVGIHLFQEEGELLKHYFVNSQGTAQWYPALPLLPRSGLGADLWQSPEAALANQVLQDRRANCATILPPELPPDVNGLMFQDNQRQFFSSPDGEKILTFRDYTISIPDCANQKTEQFGTSYVSLLDSNGEQVIFPYSQHSDPPSTPFCQPPNVLFPEQRTFVDEVVWSPDGTYVAMVVRYLRDSQNFPCAFYHIFLVNVQTLELSYLDTGRRLSWTDSGRRLLYARVERTDPNDLGIERLFSVRPDGSDRIEIPLLPDLTLLPSALDVQHTTLPWDAAGEGLLVCVGRVYTCNEVRTFFPMTQNVSPVLTTPVQMGTDLSAVFYVAGNTGLVWLSSDGRVLIQLFEESVQEVNVGLPIFEIQPLPSGIGVLLRSEEGRYFYYDVATGTVTEVGL